MTDYLHVPNTAAEVLFYEERSARTSTATVYGPRPMGWIKMIYRHTDGRVLALSGLCEHFAPHEPLRQTRTRELKTADDALVLGGSLEEINGAFAAAGLACRMAAQQLERAIERAGRAPL